MPQAVLAALFVSIMGVITHRLGDHGVLIIAKSITVHLKFRSITCGYFMTCMQHRVKFGFTSFQKEATFYICVSSKYMLI